MFFSEKKCNRLHFLKNFLIFDLCILATPKKTIDLMQLKRRPVGEFFFSRSLKCLLGALFPSLWSFSSFSDVLSATGRYLHRKLLLNQSFKN